MQSYIPVEFKLNTSIIYFPAGYSCEYAYVLYVKAIKMTHEKIETYQVDYKFLRQKRTNVIYDHDL